MPLPGFGQREPFPGYPPPLTTRPEGLLSMLGLQSNGRYPQHLAYDQLLPTMDLTLWYQESRAEILSITPTTPLLIGGSVAGSFVQIYQVPVQEHWLLLAYSINVDPVSPLGAGSVSLCRARANDSASRIALSAETKLCGAAGAGRSLICMDWSCRGLLIRPSVQIGLHVADAIGAGITINATLRFVRLQT